MNASPDMQQGMMADAARQAAIDAAYRGKLANDRRLNPTGTSGHVNPMDAARRALESNWIAQGNAGLGMADQITRNSTTGLNYNHPSYYKPNSITTPKGTPNKAILALEAARARVEGNPHGQSLGKTSYDLDPALANSGPNNPLLAIEAQIQALAGKPDIPGQWISPYSQDYLNQLGDRLGQAGSTAQQAFEAEKNDIAANYQGGIDQRNQMQGGLTAALQANGQNIGVDYAKSQGGQQASQDMAYLSQVANVNRASDLSTNDKLGAIANQTGSNLGMQAREGLLTPKQWQEGRSGLSAGDQLLADFLRGKYQNEFGAQQAEKDRLAAEASQKGMLGGFTDFAKTMTGSGSEQFQQNWPDLVQGLAGIQDPQTADEASRIWDIAGDPTAAVKYLQTDYKEANPELFKTLVAPTYMGGGNTQQQQQNNLRHWEVAKANYTYQLNQQKQQQALYKYLLDFFNAYNPNRTGVNTGRTVTNATQEKYST